VTVSAKSARLMENGQRMVGGEGRGALGWKQCVASAAALLLQQFDDRGLLLYARDGRTAGVNDEQCRGSAFVGRVTFPRYNDDLPAGTSQPPLVHRFLLISDVLRTSFDVWHVTVYGPPSRVYACTITKQTIIF